VQWLWKAKKKSGDGKCAQKQKTINKKDKRRVALRNSARLTKITSKIEVGKGQREIEVMKSRTVEK
jgi:hypothetical protein